MFITTTLLEHTDRKFLFKDLPFNDVVLFVYVNIKTLHCRLTGGDSDMEMGGWSSRPPTDKGSTFSPTGS